MSSAQTSLGTLLKVGDAQGGPYSTTIAEVKDFNPPGITLNLIDVSNHNNSSGYEEMIASALKRIPEITFEINFIYNDASHDESTGLIYLAVNSLKKHWEVVLPATSGSKSWRFAGFVTSFQPSAPVDGALTASVTIKPTDYMTIQ